MALGPRIVAMGMGLFSGWLIAFMLVMFTVTPNTGLPPTIALVFFVAWFASAWWLRRDAESTLEVIRRGFLLGAVEWFVMIFAGMAFSANAVSVVNATRHSGRGAVAAGGVSFSIFTGGASAVMIGLCMLGYIFARLLDREQR